MPNELSNLPPVLGSEETIAPRRSLPQWVFQESVEPAMPWLLVVTVVGIGLGLIFQSSWLGFTSAVLALMFSLQVILPTIKSWVQHYLTVQERRSLLGGLGFVLAIGALAHYLGVYSSLKYWLNQFKYDEFGSWAEWVGALGQIMIAVLAVYVAWQQYVISKDLTI